MVGHLRIFGIGVRLACKLRRIIQGVFSMIFPPHDSPLKAKYCSSSPIDRSHATSSFSKIQN